MHKHLLGIDYGRKKIGLAKSTSKLSEPFAVLKPRTLRELITYISVLVEQENISEVVVGISEGAMANEIKKFGEELQQKLTVPVVFSDETLTTYDALHLSINTGMRRKKRKAMEDAYAAAVMLQSYLDSR